MLNPKRAVTHKVVESRGGFFSWIGPILVAILIASLIVTCYFAFWAYGELKVAQRAQQGALVAAARCDVPTMSFLVEAATPLAAAEKLRTYQDAMEEERRVLFTAHYRRK